MTLHTVLRLIGASLSLSLGLTLMAGCSAQAPGELGRLQQIAANCPDQPLNSFVQYDGSGSGDSSDIERSRMAIIESVAERTAVCGGQLTVTVFSSSSGTTVPLYSGDVTVNAPTENARLRQVPKTVGQVMSAVRAKIGPAVASLPGGSDITSTYRLMGEQAAQFPGSRFEGYLLTDGLSNVSIEISGPLSPAEAKALAAQVDVPQLAKQASITVAGLGRVAGDPVPSDVITGMVSLYDAICARTGAGHCLSVTDWK